MTVDRDRRFPIHSGSHKSWGGLLGTSIPWEIVEPLRKHAERMHSQTLERLAERGGLSVGELGNLFIRAAAEDCLYELVRPRGRPGDRVGPPTWKAKPCPYCAGRLWVDDENWQPEDYLRRAYALGQVERRPHDGLLPCGRCNPGGEHDPVEVAS